MKLQPQRSSPASPAGHSTLTLFNQPSQPVHEALNPKGRLAKDLEITIRQATWLAHLCSLWLAFQNDDLRKAKHDPPYQLPASYPEAERINKAIRESKYYDTHPPRTATYRYRDGGWRRANRPLDDVATVPVAQPSNAKLVPWPQVFDYWWSGAMERNIRELAQVIPAENRERIEQELLK